MKTFLLSCLFAAASCMAWAQFDGPPGPEGRPMERLESLKKVRMIEMLDLKEDQSARFFARLNEHDKAHRTLRKEREEVLDKLERLLRNHADEADYEPLFQQIRTIDEKVISEMRDYTQSLRDILSVEQRAKLMLFDRRFERELRDAMKDFRTRRDAGPQ